MPAPLRLLGCWRLAAAVFCAVLAGQAAAANWVKVVDGKASQIYVDTGSISRIGDIASAWYLRDFNQPIPVGKLKYKSSRVFNYYNCAEREVAHAKWVAYEGAQASGKIVSRDKAPTLEYGDVTSDDTGEPVFNFVCNYRKPHKK